MLLSYLEGQSTGLLQGLSLLGHRRLLVHLGHSGNSRQSTLVFQAGTCETLPDIVFLPYVSLLDLVGR